MDDRSKDPVKRGLAAITAEHRRGWEGGTVSYEAIAKEVGVRKQSVWSYARRQQWERKPVPAETPPPAPHQPKPTPRLTAADAEKAEFDRLLLIEGSRILMTQVLQSLKNVGDPISRQRALATLRGIREELVSLGHFGPLFEQNEYRVPELVIRRLTPEEEVEIQRRAEEGDVWPNDYQIDEEKRNNFARVASTHGDQPTPMTWPAVDGQGAGNSDGGRAGNSYGGPLGNRQVVSTPSTPGDDRRPKQMHDLPCFNLPADSGLPDRDGFRNWLAALADKHGKITLQDMIKALGGMEPAAYDSKDREFLIAQILRLTGGDPSKLMPFVPG